MLNRKHYWSTVLLMATLPSLALAQDAAGVIAAASKAMGADNLTTIEYSGSGYDFVFGQAYSPTSPWPKFIVKSYTRSLDLRVPSSRDDRVRLQYENPPRGGGQQPVIGERRQNQTVVIGPNTPWAQQLEIWMTPYGFLKAAANNHAEAKSMTIAGRKYTLVSFTGQNKAPVNGYINEQNLVERVETLIDNPMLGDMSFRSVYSDYKDFGGVKFPEHIVQTQGDHPILDVTITDVKPNVPVTIDAPRGGGEGGARPAAQRPPTEKLADGVYLILGAGAVSLAFDFKDYAVVLEGPANEQRAHAIINETHLLIPNKPIKYVINTHHHFDHSGGLRTFVAEGATIVTQAVNKPYYEKIFAAPHTLNPDLSPQERGKQKVKVETVDEKKVMTDGNHVIELYHLQGNMHNAGLLMAYLPKEKILIQADMFAPSADPNGLALPISTYTQNFLENVDRLKLDIGRIISIHYPADGRKIMMADMMRALGKGN
jgi:glyoxylase-like metal-dependent hydrolase (beta-lactamase superfamily II)